MALRLSPLGLGFAAFLTACGAGDDASMQGSADASRDAHTGEAAASRDARVDTGGRVDAKREASPSTDAGVDSGPAPDAGFAHDAGHDVAVDAAHDAGSPGDGGGASDSGHDAAEPLPWGATCTHDTDCASALCKPVVVGTPSVCVTPCTAQSDCAADTGAFCDPLTAGGAAGYCVPQSPAHCLSCATNSDCGSLSETCLQAPGDNALACNVDCSIAGATACPSDYSCVAETVAGQARMLCRPQTIPTCLDALGGFCDRLSTPQACTRVNASGTCSGQRTCTAGTERFTDCGAAAPACKTDCSMTDPTGCQETFCASATTTVTNCGACGTVCPGYMEPNDNVTCQNGTTCTFSCQGENYDTDNSAADGCEVADAPTGNHTKTTATASGSVSDCDTPFTLTGKIVSDKTTHSSPAVTGFDVISGSAPDWFSVIGVGNPTCQNDLVLTLSVTGSVAPDCYALTIITNIETYECQTDGTGTCGVNKMSGQYSDNTTIYFEVQKTCSTAVIEAVTYAISGHL